MRTFEEIYAITAERKGDVEAILSTMDAPKSKADLAAIADDRWLACMTRCIFQAGFSWKVVENMWPGFEEAFEGFDVDRCLMFGGDDLDRLVSDKRIVRNGQKISAVLRNAAFISDLSDQHGGAGRFFAEWPTEKYADLLLLMKKQGARLGGNTGQYFLRFMGVDSFILSRDVTARLIAEGVVDRTPASQRDMAAVQEAFNQWCAQSGRSLTQVSRILAMSI
ncbi:DNA-3-methyladenine glycosylase I [Magnetospira sp. QH-2]|uniref:DNA-3-methyladenine glycosylase I n=1 Tax=Magnetospira sp. (strain QH-2) TaxID=1288970 RepID=UPI0005FA455B|nr:DNA-3-methyladenine glycosylase I [Magnetospira sp. QH-2]